MFSTVSLELFAAMPDVHAKKDAATFSAALNACISLASDEPPTYVDGRSLKLASLGKGVNIHRQALINMYAGCGSLEDAHRLFLTLKDSPTCETALAALMSAYVQNGQPEMALHLFFSLQQQVSDARLLLAAFKACMALAEKETSCKLATLETCDEQCPASLTPTLHARLRALYSRCGSMCDARKAFESVSHPDVALWNALMAGYVENGEVWRSTHEGEEIRPGCFHLLNSADKEQADAASGVGVCKMHGTCS